MAYIVMAYLVMTYIVMAYVVMAYSYGLYNYVYSCGVGIHSCVIPTCARKVRICNCLPDPRRMIWPDLVSPAALVEELDAVRAGETFLQLSLHSFDRHTCVDRQREDLTYIGMACMGMAMYLWSIYSWPM